MSTSCVTRRAALRSLGAFAMILPRLISPARAQTAARFRDVRVDVWPLRGSAGDQIADWVEDELPRDLAHALAPFMAPAERNGATLIARIDTINFGGASAGRGSAGSVDSIEGILIMGSRSGRAAQTPLRATASYQASAVDQPLFEEAYHSRVAALVEAFAGWAPRQLGI